MIEIDGSYGEGGGQILRTALAFSVILKLPILMRNIRAGRKNPGLGHQHLAAVNAAARISGAEAEGNSLGSQTLRFIPKDICPGEYQFDVGTAGSVTLLLQALLLPLCLARSTSSLTLVGGTHVPWSPPFHYLSEVLFPTVKTMGISVDAAIQRWGWYPRGGGMIRVKINPCSEIRPITLLDRGSARTIRAMSAISGLPKHVTERQRDRTLKRIKKELNKDIETEVLYDAPADGQGSFLFLVAEYERSIAGFSSLGARGKPAEQVADEAIDSLRNYVASDGCVDPHLADQLVPFVALAEGNSSFTTARMTEHLFTNVWVIGHFMETKIQTWGELGRTGRVDFLNE